MNKPLAIWLILIFAILSTGCSSIVKAEQPAVVESPTLDNSLSLGQTFNAKFNGMDGIEIYLAPLETGEGNLQLFLREDVQTLKNLAVVSLPLAEISAPGFYHFQIPVQPESNQQNYYLLLKIKGTGSVEVGSAPGDTYLNGALYQGNQPKNHRQMAFKLSYYAPRMGLGIFVEILTWVWYLLVAAFLFVVPGWAVLSRLWPNFDDSSLETATPSLATMRSPVVKLALSIGISLSIYPIFLLWSDLLKLHLGALYAWLPPILGSLYLLWANARKWKKGEIHFRLPKLRLSDFVLVFVILLIITTRFWAIRSLPLPLWGDSYHHTMIAQLLADNKGLFDSWQPYTDAVTFTYHFGFHTAVTTFYWITGIPITEAVLWVGQIINIFAVLTLYPLALKIFKKTWSGIAALLVAGLLSPMPMFYINWGRYTQLTGLALLLVAVWFTWVIFESKKLHWQMLALTWMVVSGLAMTHYRVLIFYLAFVLSYSLLHLKNKAFIPIIQKTFWIGLGAGILYLPWFINVFGGGILTLFRALATEMPTITNNNPADMIADSIGDITIYLPVFMWVSVMLTLIICLWQKQRAIALIGLWWLILVLLANPHWLRLPGQGILDNFTVFLAVYIPAGLILAIIPEWLSKTVNSSDARATVWAKYTLTCLAIIVASWGAWQRFSEIHPERNSLATQPDIKAATWIQENVHDEARFLVNTFIAYNGYAIVGSDGGWWLPLLAERQTNLPPITYILEDEPTPGYNQWIEEPTQMIQDYGITHPDTLATLAAHGITHVYIGQRQGRVNYPGPHILRPQELREDPHFEMRYHQDRVWIFEFIQ